MSSTMASYRDPATRADRAKAILAVAAVHLAMAGAVLLGGGTRKAAAPEPLVPQLIEVRIPPPPPPPRPEPAARPEREEGAAGRKAEPSPIVAPAPKLVLPTPNPLPAAPVAGTGNAPAAGAAEAGAGPGAGGSGAGPGGGGAGGIGEDARLLFGGLTRRDYRYLRRFSATDGRATLDLLIGPDGRVQRCSIHRSSGEPALDAALCALLQPRMRWAPARDRSGRPLTVGLYYTATWGRD